MAGARCQAFARCQHTQAAGAPLEVVQQNSGHPSLDTTTRYVTTEAARRMAAMQAVWDTGKGDRSPAPNPATFPFLRSLHV